MILDKIKKSISTSLLLKAFLLIFLIVGLVFYFKVFYTVGIRFDNAFLKKEVESSDTHYRGRNMYGNIHIIVKGIKNKHRNADVVYMLPNNINRKYTVEFKDENNWDLGISNIKNEYGAVIFEGSYSKYQPFLVDKSGQQIIEINIQITGNRISPYNADYKVSLKNTADLAMFLNETIRGRHGFLLLAILLFVIISIDIKYPLFFFRLDHFLSVKDPEPSDFYISVQKASWYIVPIIGVLLMTLAIN